MVLLTLMNLTISGAVTKHSLVVSSRNAWCPNAAHHIGCCFGRVGTVVSFVAKAGGAVSFVGEFCFHFKVVTGIVISYLHFVYLTHASG